MDMNLTLLAIALSPTTIMVTFIIFGLRSFRNDLNTGMDRLDKRMDRLDKKTDHDRGRNRRSFEKLFEMVGDVSERVARIEGYVGALSFFTGAELPSTMHPKSHRRPDDQTLPA